MVKVVFQNCEILRITPWTEDKFILSLLSRERSIFSALYKTPQKTKHFEKDLFPNLFQSIEGVLQFQPDGKHRLRDFDVQHSPSPLSLKRYTGLCLLSKILQLSVHEHLDDPQPYTLWKLHQHRDFDEPHWTEVLCDLHWIWGTWPSAERCERCGKSRHQLGANIDRLNCEHCVPSIAIWPKPLLNWIQQRYQSSNTLALPSEDAKLLRRFLWRRLPEPLHSDEHFRRLTQAHFDKNFESLSDHSS